MGAAREKVRVATPETKEALLIFARHALRQPQLEAL
jgi:hypothetical protein